jgi:hypothetical protein
MFLCQITPEDVAGSQEEDVKSLKGASAAEAPGMVVEQRLPEDACMVMTMDAGDDCCLEVYFFGTRKES